MRLFLSLLTFSLCLQAYGDFDPKSFLKTYDTAMASDADAIRKVIKELDTVLALAPGNPEALIFKGSLVSKTADLDFWFWNKLYLVNEGIDLMAKGMDRLEGPAGKDIPEDRRLTMYLIHGITSAYIPDMFKQVPVATRELERSKAHALFASVPTVSRAEALALLSQIYKKSGRTGDSAALQQQAMNLDAAKTKLVLSK